MRRSESTLLRVKERRKERNIKRDIKALAKQETDDCNVFLNTFQTEMFVHYQFGCSELKS